MITLKLQNQCSVNGTNYLNIATGGNIKTGRIFCYILFFVFISAFCKLSFIADTHLAQWPGKVFIITMWPATSETTKNKSIYLVKPPLGLQID